MFFIVNLFVAAFSILILKKISLLEITILKQLGLFEILWATFSILIGLYFLFDVLESKTPEQPFAMAAGKETFQLFYILSGFILLHISIAGVVIVRILKARTK